MDLELLRYIALPLVTADHDFLFIPNKEWLAGLTRQKMVVFAIDRATL